MEFLKDINLKGSDFLTAREIKTAFKEKLPVIYCAPNEEPIECSHIIAIIYRRHPNNGNILVSVELPDSKCPHSIIIARGNKIKLKE